MWPTEYSINDILLLLRLGFKDYGFHLACPPLLSLALSGKLSGDCPLSHLNRPFPSNLWQSRGLALPDSSQHSETKTIKPTYFKVVDCCSDEIISTDVFSRLSSPFYYSVSQWIFCFGYCRLQLWNFHLFFLMSSPSLLKI